MEELKDCQDCGAKPGEPHKDGCDMERCSVCGGQRLSCDCEGHDKAFARWTGLWPGYAEAKLLGVDLNGFSVMYSRIFFVKPELDGVTMREALDGARKSNPYPSDVFTEPTGAEYRRMREALHAAGLAPDKFFGAFGRRVWNICLDRVGRELLGISENGAEGRTGA